MTTNENLQKVQSDIPLVDPLISSEDSASEELSDLELEAIAGGYEKAQPATGSSPLDPLVELLEKAKTSGSSPFKPSAIDQEMSDWARQRQEERNPRIEL